MRNAPKLSQIEMNKYFRLGATKYRWNNWAGRHEFLFGIEWVSMQALDNGYRP